MEIRRLIAAGQEHDRHYDEVYAYYDHKYRNYPKLRPWWFMNKLPTLDEQIRKAFPDVKYIVENCKGFFGISSYMYAWLSREKSFGGRDHDLCHQVGDCYGCRLGLK